MKRLFITISALFIALSAAAQSPSTDNFFEKARQEFEQFNQQSKKAYDDFRQRANATYAEFLKHAWKEVGMEEPIEPPKVDPPVQPVAPPLPPREADKPLNPKPLSFKSALPMNPPKVTPFPKYEIPKPEPKEEPFLLPMPVNYFGTTCNIRLKMGTGEVKLPIPDNNSVSTAWTELSDGRFDIMFSDCMEIRKNLKLNDWGYFQLAKKVAEEFCESKNSNNSKILQAFLMTQAGYKIRMGRYNNKLFLLFPVSEPVNGKSFVRIDNQQYYMLDDDAALAKSIYICDAAFPGEIGFSLDMPEVPELKVSTSISRVHKSRKYPDLSIEIEPNMNLISFFNTYPQAPWKTFAYGSLSQRTKDIIYPVIRKAIEGKSESAAANMIINLIQTGFEYKTDHEQFGQERSLFGDESLFYAYCDCEDRAILYSILVRDLLGLKAALLHYPGHLAAAVCFSDGKVYGDYLEVNGDKYTVCDPTYIGATIGMTMHTMKNSEAEVILL